MMPLSPDAVRSLWTTLLGDGGADVVFLGDCFFHTVEAQVAVEQSEDIDPLALFVLRAFEFAQRANAEGLDEVLHLGRQVMRQLLGTLVASGLLTESPPTYRLTDQGRGTLQTRRLVRRVLQRRLFHFLHPAMRYVAVHDPKGNLLCDLSPSRAPAPWEFDPSALREAAARPAEWKRRHRFPQDVAEVITAPVSPDAAGESSPTASDAAGTGQAPAAPQHLVVDKAQVITCALAARAEGPDVREVVGYPISAHGSLLRGKGQPLFALDDAEDILRAFPAIRPESNAEEVTESWMALAARSMLPEPERAVVRFEEGRLVALLTADLLGRWGTFVALAVQDQLRWHVAHGPLLRVCPVAVEGADAAASVQLQALRSVLRLEQDPKRADIVRSAAALRDWLAAQGLQPRPSPRGLADLAFRFGRYRLAYQVGELEDMADAPV
jgi:hypothetical protein